MTPTLKTTRLTLTMRSLENTKEWVASLPPEVQREISPIWLARLNGAIEPTPWICGFDIVRSEDQASVGSCAFKSPPENGLVEIAYGIEDAYQRQGFATEAAVALTEFALADKDVRTVCAHTKQDNIASIKVLEKAGFTAKGTVIDPEDGEVLRYERVC
jgi:ribosomal-protein-alanine N-acetyltransferase